MRRLVIPTTDPITPQAVLEAIRNATDFKVVEIADGESVALLKDRLQAIHALVLKVM